MVCEAVMPFPTVGARALSGRRIMSGSREPPGRLGPIGESYRARLWLPASRRRRPATNEPGDPLAAFVGLTALGVVGERSQKLYLVD